MGLDLNEVDKVKLQSYVEQDINVRLLELQRKYRAKTFSSVVNAVLKKGLEALDAEEAEG